MSIKMNPQVYALQYDEIRERLQDWLTHEQSLCQEETWQQELTKLRTWSLVGCNNQQLTTLINMMRLDSDNTIVRRLHALAMTIMAQYPMWFEIYEVEFFANVMEFSDVTKKHLRLCLNRCPTLVLFPLWVGDQLLVTAN